MGPMGGSGVNGAKSRMGSLIALRKRVGKCVPPQTYKMPKALDTAGARQKLMYRLKRARLLP